MNLLKRARAFFLGAAEFRSSLTTSLDDHDSADAYDRGRELAHRLTLRRYEQ